jgi:predicted lactoylglutathione lyase
MSSEAMELGAFSISLTVSDLGVSRSFYETLGFEKTGGDEEHYLIMVNDTAVIGLFQGMFDRNILTFNPGLTSSKEQLSDFTDIRQLRDRLVAAGIEMTSDLDPEGDGPASIAFLDPDGNPVLIDQFFPKP